MADWESQAAAELDRLTAPHAAKKRTTIVALVDARLAGRTEESVWQRDDTCSRSVYHEKWKKDPTFADVLGKVTALARQWQDGRSIRALALAAERLALASPVAVAKAITLMSSADEQIAIRAAFGILDRAGAATATKATTVQTLDADQFAVLAAQAKAKAGAVNEAAAMAWNPEQKPTDDADPVSPP